jgi:hypothetical protein
MPKAIRLIWGSNRKGDLHQRRERRDRDLGERQADQPAEHRQHHRLDQELQQHLARDRADGEADADLARPLGHRDEHDVHDADAADEQADRGHRGDDLGQQGGRAGQRVADLLGIEDVEIVLLAAGDVAALAQQILIEAWTALSNRPDRRRPDQRTSRLPVKRRCTCLDRHDHDIVLIAAEAAWPRVESRPITSQDMPPTRIRVPTGSPPR